jgi:RNA polymerase sigma-70 factor (ECF subfamily)
MSIVRHRAIYLTRRRALLAAHNDGSARLEEQPAKDDLPADFAMNAETEKLQALLNMLPAAQQQVIQLGFFEELTHQQIALRLALPPGTVKGRMRLGLNKLRTELEA